MEERYTHFIDWYFKILKVLDSGKNQILVHPLFLFFG
jgi:hypothetical protein